MSVQSYKGQGIDPYRGNPIPKQKIKEAIEANPSMRSAGQSLHVAYNTFKKYALQYNLWNPRPTSKGIKRIRKSQWNGHVRHGIKAYLQIMDSAIKRGELEQKCSHCGYNEYRKSDAYSPMIPYFIDGNEQNTKIENIRVFCYNCFFILFDIKHRPTATKNDVKHLREVIEEVTGDSLRKELTDEFSENLSDLFIKL